MASATVVDVAMQYRAQFESTVENLRNRGQSLNQDVIQLTEELKNQLQTAQQEGQQIQEDVTKAVQDMSPVEDPETHKFLLETYLWTSVCLFGMGVGQLVGTYFLRYFLGMAFSTWVTVLLAYLILPLWFLAREYKTTKTEEERRMTLFGLSLILGILTGYNLADLRLSFFAPPAFLLPLSIALAAGSMGSSLGKDRKIYLGASLGVAVVLYLMLGLISRSFRLPYLLWVIISTSVTGIIQILRHYLT